MANPSRTGDLYFVADGTGGHAFAETVDQHVKNVQRWRQIERDAKDKSNAVDVDKVTPSALPGVSPLRPNQRSESSGSIFGGLATNFGTDGGTRLPSFGDPLDQQFGPARDFAFGSDAKKDLAFGSDAKKKAPSNVKSSREAALIVSPGLDTMGLSLRGVRPSAADVLDGPVSSVSDDPAPASGLISPSADAGPTQIAAAIQHTPPEHPKIFDVSEGTALDPLHARGYDLNSAKTIPDFSKGPP